MNREEAVAWGLGGAGLVKGVFQVYIRPELTAKRAWSAMAAGILAYEILCPQGELLSEGADNALERHPALTRLAIGATALHLANALPDRIDPFKHTLDLLKRF